MRHWWVLPVLVGVATLLMLTYAMLGGR
jgi:hypothetical protein